MGIKDYFADNTILRRSFLITGVGVGIISILSIGKTADSKRNKLLENVERIADKNQDGIVDGNERARVFEQLGIDYVPNLYMLSNEQKRQYLASQGE